MGHLNVENFWSIQKENSFVHLNVEIFGAYKKKIISKLYEIYKILLLLLTKNVNN